MTKNTHITSVTRQMYKKFVQEYNLTLPIEQSDLWQKFDNKIAGRTPLGYYAYMSGNLPLAIFTMTLYSNRGYNWAWIKHGPIWIDQPKPSDSKAFTEVLKKFIAIKITPNVCFVRLNLDSQTSGAHLPLQHTMYEKTVVIDLSQSLEEIQADMTQSGRRDLRKALKSNLTTIEIVNVSAKTFKPYYEILSETSARDEFGIHSAKLYVDMLTSLDDNARLFAINQSDSKTPLAWAIVTTYRGKALYYYGASSAQARQFSAPYQLHWDIMNKLKDEGIKSYDFMGIASENYPGLKNVSVFKQKFSGTVTDVKPTYDIIIQPFRYHLLKLLYILRRR